MVYFIIHNSKPYFFPGKLCHGISRNCRWQYNLYCNLQGPDDVLVMLPNLALELRNSLEVSFCIGQISIERDELHSAVVRSSAANSCLGRQTGSIRLKWLELAEHFFIGFIWFHLLFICSKKNKRKTRNENATRNVVKFCNWGSDFLRVCLSDYI